MHIRPDTPAAPPSGCASVLSNIRCAHKSSARFPRKFSQNGSTICVRKTRENTLINEKQTHQTVVYMSHKWFLWIYVVDAFLRRSHTHTHGILPVYWSKNAPEHVVATLLGSHPIDERGRQFSFPLAVPTSTNHRGGPSIPCLEPIASHTPF